MPHPLGVLPLGVLFLNQSASNLRAIPGALGLLARLTDELLLVLLGWCDASSLGRCMAVSHALRIFSHCDDLWRALVLDELPNGMLLRYTGCWRNTYVKLFRPFRVSLGLGTNSAPSALAAPGHGVLLYSDALFERWQCGTAAIPQGWQVFENIQRVSAATLSVAKFEELYEVPGRPVILADVVPQWEAFQCWSEEKLCAQFGDTPFHVGGHEMRLRDFFSYAHTTTDEMPLYLFDKSFAQCAPSLAAEYQVPAFFAPERDLFAQLPPGYRPDHRWLIIGGTRSGSSWHVDPNATSAWNGVVRGTKKWVLCPPHAPPPGITASADGTTVTAPLSLFEWFRIFYPLLAERRGGRSGAREALVHEGELLFVPRGWWHAALNCEPTIAITQNYAPPCSAAHVLQYLSSKRADALVSGVAPELRATLHTRFAEMLKQHFPAALEVAKSGCHTDRVAEDDANNSCSTTLFTFNF